MQRRTALLLPLNAIVVPLAQGADFPFAGKWKLNHGKSRFSHGTLPNSLVITLAADGPNGLRYQSKNQVGEKTGGMSYAARLDGSAASVTGSASYETASLQRVDARTLRVQMKKNGAVIVDAVYQVAADGKSLTRKGTAKKGPNEVNTFEEWFDRIP
ncbi:MAG: hypothetical protein HY820_45895 [Acidobacteria bacterium]|nr:hypothetical protein [Acidobacteriota bacterium]